MYSDSAFVVLMFDSEGHHLAQYDSIVQGLTIRANAPQSRGGWGTAAWFDKVSAQMRMIAIQSAPQTEQDGYRIRDVRGGQYSFCRITKPIYDSIVQRLIPDAPTVHTDREAQEYVSHLNPYE